jgi:hypothetical protein
MEPGDLTFAGAALDVGQTPLGQSERDICAYSATATRSNVPLRLGFQYPSASDYCPTRHAGEHH